MVFSWSPKDDKDMPDDDASDEAEDEAMNAVGIDDSDFDNPSHKRRRIAALREPGLDDKDVKLEP